MIPSNVIATPSSRPAASMMTAQQRAADLPYCQGLNQSQIAAVLAPVKPLMIGRFHVPVL